MLDSALAQKTNFEFRIVIGDDFSIDGSREVLQEYEAKYKDQIKVIYQERNLGFKSSDTNGLRILKCSTAKYVAFLDGDDYWVDTLKLQKQIDFLENHKEYVACCSNVFEKIGDELEPIIGKLDKTTFDDLVLGNSIHTCSVVFRNIVEIPEWYTQCKMGDWVIWLLLAKHGDIYRFKEIMAVYRVHNKGIWIGKGKEMNLKGIIAAYDIFINKFPLEDKKRFKQGAKLYYSQLLNLLSSEKSNKIFYWSNRAFWFDYDIKRCKFILIYLRNILFPKRGLPPQ